MSHPQPTRQLNDLEIRIPPEIYVMVAEQLGKEIIDRPPAELADDDGPQNDDLDDADNVTGVRLVTKHIKWLYPTLSMLKASMVNRYYRERILLIALRWDALSENPRALYYAAVNNHVKVLRQALAQNNARPDYVPYGLSLPMLTPLMVAAAKGYLEVVQLLLDKNADAAREFNPPDSWDRWGATGLLSESYETMHDEPDGVATVRIATPLHCAMSAPSNAAAITERILARLPAAFFERVANPDSKILVFAVAADLVDVIDLLMNHNADLNDGGITEHLLLIPVIHHAVSGRMVRKLLQHGANLHTPLAVGLNALHAVCLRSTDCHTAIEELVHRGVAVNDATGGGAQRATIVHHNPHLRRRTPQTALNFACRCINLSHIKSLMNLGANPLGVASTISQCQDRENGEFYMVTPFHSLFLPTDLNEKLTTNKDTDLRERLHGAVQELLAHPLGGRALLLRQNVRFNTYSESVKIFHTYWADRGDMDVEEFGEFTPFQLFFMHPLVDDERIPDAMLRADSQAIRQQINQVTEPFGATPLLSVLSHRFDNRFAQSSFYRPKLVEWLLANGADPNIADKEGFTPLHYAVFWLDDVAVDFLLAFGARIENRPTSLPTPLEVAMGRVYKDIHMKRDLEDSIWKQMVRLTERNGEQWKRDLLGLQTSIALWRPGGLLPVCALPGFEKIFKRTLHFDDEAYIMGQNVGIHEALRERGVDVMLREQALKSKRHIFESLVQASGTLPLPIPECIEHVGTDMKTYRYSVLDWAAATDQDEHFLARLLQIGGPELSGTRPPTFNYWSFTYFECRDSWNRFKETLWPKSESSMDLD
ncbi:hypothetical protein CSUB01_02179 [Colletotrichum sublineola]|uniref:Ankyrin repeat protein n=1 Tax=Colletotrichum sublineola TaxID=1173701 RepID=A0A066WYR3_COLSU|nr:hypothetical protein CSUB01_02179 [Colletotrichum sublineola]